MAQTMSFEGIMGSSCGRVFRKAGYSENAPAFSKVLIPHVRAEYSYPDSTKNHGDWKKVVADMPKWPWIKLHP
jgi:hypothetical protein